MKPSSPYKILLIGGSAGSLEVILPLTAALSPQFCLPVVIVLHRRSDTDNRLAELIASRATLPVKEAEEKQPIQNGNIYVAPADYHLLFETDHSFSLDYSEKVNYSRPSIDVSFESAAQVYGPSMVSLLLSGANEDGSEGLRSVQQAGGLTLVQSPDSAVVPYMPKAALKLVKVDKVLTNAEIAPFLNALCHSKP